MGEEVCIGANGVQGYGNPTLHGKLLTMMTVECTFGARTGRRHPRGRGHDHFGGRRRREKRRGSTRVECQLTFCDSNGSTGEIAAINNCTKILTDPEGKYNLSPAEALKALSDLSLYTTAEPCPMVRTRLLTSPPTLYSPVISVHPFGTPLNLDGGSKLSRRLSLSRWSDLATISVV